MSGVSRCEPSEILNGTSSGSGFRLRQFLSGKGFSCLNTQDDKGHKSRGAVSTGCFEFSRIRMSLKGGGSPKFIHVRDSPLFCKHSRTAGFPSASPSCESATFLRRPLKTTFDMTTLILEYGGCPLCPFYSFKRCFWRGQ